MSLISTGANHTNCPNRLYSHTHPNAIQHSLLNVITVHMYFVIRAHIGIVCIYDKTTVYTCMHAKWNSISRPHLSEETPQG